MIAFAVFAIIDLAVRSASFFRVAAPSTRAAVCAAAWRAHALGGCEAADAAVAGSRKAVLDAAAAAQVALHRMNSAGHIDTRRFTVAFHRFTHSGTLLTRRTD